MGEDGGDSKLVTLTCPNHRDLVIRGLWNRFLDETRTDMSLQHDGRSIRAHRLIVELFLPPDKMGASVQKQQEAPADENSTEGGSTNGEQDNVTSMLAFMYNGSVTVREDNLANLREMARGLGFKMLVDAIELTMPKSDKISETVTRPAARRSAVRRTFPMTKHVRKRVVATETREDELGAGTERNQLDGDTISGAPYETGRRSSFSELFPYLRCRFCHYKTKSDVLRGMHERSKHAGHTPLPIETPDPTSNADGMWPCPLCGKTYTNRSNLGMHLRSTHSQSRNYACGICEYRAVTPGIIRRHRLTHTDSRPHTCEKCGANYKSLASFRLHLRRHEFGDNRCHVCDVCGRAFNRRENLKVHLRIHSKERPFRCEVETCGKAFGTRQTLVFHTQTHTGFRPFQCDECPKAYGQRQRLAIHKRNQHSGEATSRPPRRNRTRAKRTPAPDGSLEIPDSDQQQRQPTARKARLPGPRPKKPPNSGEFACTKCSTVLKNHRSLLWHLRQHRLAENPMPGQHVCIMCDKRFRKHGNFRIHLERVHGATTVELVELDTME